MLCNILNLMEGSILRAIESSRIQSEIFKVRGVFIKLRENLMCQSEVSPPPHFFYQSLKF
jgi:hypothetical protein